MLDCKNKKGSLGTSLVVQWLRLQAPNVGGMGSIPGWGAKVLHAAWRSQKKKVLCKVRKTILTTASFKKFEKTNFT